MFPLFPANAAQSHAKLCNRHAVGKVKPACHVSPICVPSLHANFMAGIEKTVAPFWLHSLIQTYNPHGDTDVILTRRSSVCLLHALTGSTVEVFMGLPKDLPRDPRPDPGLVRVRVNVLNVSGPGPGSQVDPRGRHLYRFFST